MNMFANLKNDGLEENEDRLGGGFQPFTSDIYDGTIKMAYAGQSQGGARSVTVLVDIGGKEYRETLWVTNKKGENWFLNKNDNTKKVALPGFTTVEDICLVTTGVGLSEQNIEEKLVKVWDPEQRKEMPKNMPVLVDLIGKPVTLGIIENLEDKTEKDGSGNYVPTGDTRKTNSIEKVFESETKMTVVEAKRGLEAGEFYALWADKNRGSVRDRTAKNDNGPKTGRPGNAGGPPQAGASSAPTKSLFGAKKTAA